MRILWLVISIITAIVAIFYISIINTNTAQVSWMSNPSSPPNDRKYKALVLGATGGTGKAVLRELLAGERWSHVTTVGRRNVPAEQLQGVPTEKLTQVEVDTSKDGFENAKDSFEGIDAVFSCIGTTRATAGGQENYRKIDYGLPLQAASYAKKNNTPYFSVITTVGANPTSFASYAKLKGEIEEDLKALSFPRLSIIRPGFLVADRNGTRSGEEILKFTWNILSHVLPTSVSSIPVETIAIAMRRDAEHKLDSYDRTSAPSHEIFHNGELFAMAK